MLRGAILAIAFAVTGAGQNQTPAEQELIRNAERRPNSADAHYALGSFYFQAGRPDRAVPSFERATKLAPERAALWKALGAAYVAQTQFRLAESPLRKACELDPALEAACYYLGRDLYASNQFEPAVAAFEKALRFGPPPSRWLADRGLGMAFEALGRGAEAEKAFHSSIDSMPAAFRADEDPRVDYAVFLIRQGRAGEAVAPLEEHLKRFPDSSRGNFELGRVLSQSGKLESAAAHIEKAVQADPQYWAAHLLLGRVYMRLGRNEEGERHLRVGEKGTSAEQMRN